MESPGHDPVKDYTFASPRVRKYLLALLCAVLALKALIFFSRAACVVSYPYEWSTMDGYYVYYGLRLISGRPIYFGYQSMLMPFEYVPLYPAAIGVLAKIFGSGVWYERTFGLTCAVAVAILIFRAVSSANGNRAAALCSALMFFAPAALSVWFLVRGMDILAALLALAGVSVAAGEQDRWKHWLGWTTVLFVLAFYTKQTTLFPAAGAVAYVMSRGLKRGVVMGISFALITAGLFLLFQSTSGGWFFENAFVTTSMNPYYPRLLLGLFRDFSLIFFVAFPIAFVQATRGLTSRPGIWTFYFFSTLFSAFLAAKVGAAMSYFIPLFTAVCIQIGLWLGDSRLFERRPRLCTGILILFLIQSFGFFANRIPVPTQEDYLQAEALDSQIKAHPGPMLVERIDSFATLNERDLNVEAVQLPLLIMRRKFDPQPLLQAVRDKEFSLVIYSGAYFGGIPALKQSIFENYRVIERVRLRLFFGEMTFLVLAPG